MTERFIFLDTEATGMTGQDRILEIGLVEVVNGRLTGERIDTLVYTPQPIHWAATRVHGRRAHDLVGKPAFRDIAKDVLDFIGTDRAFAHNARFDAGMMNREWEDLGLAPHLRPTLTCTLPVARAVRGGKGHKVGLDALIPLYLPGTPKRGHHSAAEDAEILARIFLAMREAHPDIVNRVLRGINPAKIPDPEVKARERQERRAAMDADLPQTLNPGVAEGIAQANASGRLEDALRLRVGRDYVTRMIEADVRARAGSAACAAASDLGHPADVLGALRMIVRGLRPDLAVSRQQVFAAKRAETEAARPEFPY